VHYRQITSKENRIVKFKKDGTFSSKTDQDETKECDGKTIEQLYLECNAFNFVTEKVTKLNALHSR